MMFNNLSEPALIALAQKLGKILRGNECIELVGDVGAGKTTFTRGVARGLGIDEDIQSPTFTLSRIYVVSNAKQLVHYDFYRLRDPGILAAELEEMLEDDKTITIIEWGEIVSGVLPENRITFRLTANSENTRDVTVSAVGAHEKSVVEQLV